MKNLILSFLCLLSMVTTAQTLGEIRIDTTTDDVFVGYNSFLRRQPTSDRISYHSNTFKTKPDETLQFFSVMNVSKDTVEYYDGGTTVHYLPPWSAITGEAIFDESGLLIAGPNFVWVVDSKARNGLFVVERKCKNCHYYREAIGYNEKNFEKITFARQRDSFGWLSVSGLLSSNNRQTKESNRGRFDSYIRETPRYPIHPYRSLSVSQH